MILIDYITANTDRHWSNFAVIRNAETLKTKYLAPIFDNGAALFLKIPTREIKDTNNKLLCQSFRRTQKENIKLVSDYTLLQHSKAGSLIDIINDVYKNNDDIEDGRKTMIIKYIQQRINAAVKRR